MPGFTTNKLVNFLALFCYSGVLALVLFFPLSSSAAFTKQINYQGKLTTSAGVAVTNGSYSIQFKLYQALTGGSAIWTENQTVTVTSGLFSVMLGSVTSLDSLDFNQPLYLSINVNSDGEMSPRKILGSVASAFEAVNTQTFGGLATTSFLRADINNVSALFTRSTTTNATTTGASYLGTSTGLNNQYISQWSDLEAYLPTVTGWGTSSDSLNFNTLLTSSTTLTTLFTNAATAYSWGNHAGLYLANLLGGLNGIFSNTTTTNATTSNLVVTNLADTYLSVNGLGQVIATTTPTSGISTSLTKGYTLVGNNAGIASATSSLFITEAGKIGIGLTNPSTALDVVGTASSTALQVNGNSVMTGYLMLTGSFFDSLHSAGSNGMVLQSTGSASKWVATSTLNIATAAAGATGQIQYNNGSNALTASSNFTYTGDGYLKIINSSLPGHINSGIDSTASGDGDIAASGQDLYLSSGGTISMNGGQDYAYGGAAGSLNLVWGGNGFGGASYDGNDGKVTIGNPLGKKNASLLIYGSATTTALDTYGTASSTGLQVNGNSIVTGTLGVTGKTTLVNASTSNITASGWISVLSGLFTNATTSSLAISSLGSTFLSVNGLGQVVATATPILSFTASGLLSSSGGVNPTLTMPLTKGYTIVGNNAGIASATSSLFITEAGNVGIGTTSPATKLDVYGDATFGTGAAGADSVASFSSSSVVKWVMGHDTTDGSFAIASSSLGTKNVLTINSDGRVGIGTSTPNSALVIGNGTATSSMAIPLGSICVDSDGWCAPGAVDGSITALHYNTANSDLAENYQVFEVGLSAGDIVSASDVNTATTNNIIDSFGLRLAQTPDNILGVISTNPGVTLGSSNEDPNNNKLPVALSGRVPVKVNLEGGSIKVGDRITLSSVAGVGAKATSSTQTVGIALESFSSGSIKDGNGVGKVLVFISLGYTHLDSQIAGGQINASNFWHLDEATGQIKVLASLTSASGNWSIDSDGNITAKTLQVEKLCLGATCVTEGELKTLLNNANLTPVIGPIIIESSTPPTSTPPVVAPEPTPTSTEPVVEPILESPPPTSSEPPL
jgi:hypothetical protein